MAKSFDELVDRVTTKKTRQRAAVRAQEMLRALLLIEIRALSGKSQKEVAASIGIKQPSLSKLEKQSDMQVSTLRRIVKALGSELEVLAKFPNATVKIDPFTQARRRPKQRIYGGGEGTQLEYELSRVPFSTPRPLFHSEFHERVLGSSRIALAAREVREGARRCMRRNRRQLGANANASFAVSSSQSKPACISPRGARESGMLFGRLARLRPAAPRQTSQTGLSTTGRLCRPVAEFVRIRSCTAAQDSEFLRIPLHWALKC